MINNHHRFLNWIERRAKTHPHKPESFFTTLGHLNQVNERFGNQRRCFATLPES